MNNNELYHHGRLGQKWGKRNGPPYPLDESDYSAEEKKQAKVKNKESNQNNPLSDANQHFYKTAQIVRKHNAKKDETDLSEYSDAELQRIVNRMRLEQSYHQMNSGVKSSGKEKAAEILDNAGDVLTVVAAATGIALTIKKLLGK